MTHKETIIKKDESVESMTDEQLQTLNNVLVKYLDCFYSDQTKTSNKRCKIYRKNAEDKFGIFSISEKEKRIFLHPDFVKELRFLFQIEKMSPEVYSVLRKWFVKENNKVDNNFVFKIVSLTKTKCSCSPSIYDVLI
jgi:hypothetical protein